MADPIVEGSEAHPVSLDPWQRVVEVGWGGVIALLEIDHPSPVAYRVASDDESSSAAGPEAAVGSEIEKKLPDDFGGEDIHIWEIAFTERYPGEILYENFVWVAALMMPQQSAAPSGGDTNPTLPTTFDAAPWAEYWNQKIAYDNKQAWLSANGHNDANFATALALFASVGGGEVRAGTTSDSRGVPIGFYGTKDEHVSFQPIGEYSTDAPRGASFCIDKPSGETQTLYSTVSECVVSGADVVNDVASTFGPVSKYEAWVNKGTGNFSHGFFFFIFPDFRAETVLAGPFDPPEKVDFNTIEAKVKWRSYRRHHSFIINLGKITGDVKITTGGWHKYYGWDCKIDADPLAGQKSNFRLRIVTGAKLFAESHNRVRVEGDVPLDQTRSIDYNIPSGGPLDQIVFRFNKEGFV
jgi:hypothetical protein